jgi:hypothetical protein
MMAATLDCTIERRLLVNYRIEPGLVANLLPAPFRPQLVAGMAVGGICTSHGVTRAPGSPPLGAARSSPVSTIWLTLTSQNLTTMYASTSHPVTATSRSRSRRVRLAS